MKMKLVFNTGTGPSVEIYNVEYADRISYCDT